MTKLDINGEIHEVDAQDGMPLLWVMREDLDITGPKYGCGHGVCGGCIVSVDGYQEHSCKVTPADVEGKAILTVEGLTGPVADALLDAWTRLDVSQCGFCQPAQLTSAYILLSHRPDPTDEEVDQAMLHNLCRCGTYARIRAAIAEASITLTHVSTQSAVSA